MEKYRHSQPGWVMIFCFSAIIILFMVMPLEPKTDQKIAVAIMAACLALFYKLTVIIDDKFVFIRFGYGIIRVKYALSDIASVSIVKNGWWYGWGIRSLGSGWLYNVSGLDAVELKLKNGKIHRIGTDEPEELERLLRENIKSQ